VYSVGRFTPIYMALMNSFRRLVVYPSAPPQCWRDIGPNFRLDLTSRAYLLQRLSSYRIQRGSLTKDRDPSASRVENRLAESGADPMSPPLGATSGDFDSTLYIVQGVSVDRRTWLLEQHVASGGYFFAARAALLQRTGACASAETSGGME